MQTKNYKTLLTEIEEDLNKWKDILCSWIKRLTMAILPKLIYRFNAIPIKIQGGLCRNWQDDLKMHMEMQETHNSQTVLKKKKKVGGFTLPDFKTYYKAIVIRRMCYWHKVRHTDQWNKTENLEIHPYMYGQLIFNRNVKTIK